jgi:hypothetical protein
MSVLGVTHVMPRAAKGYIEQLPSGSFRVTVYVGTDPLTGRAIRLKATARTEQQARIELGRLLKDASEGRTPESAATVATLLEEYALVAPWDVSTRQTNEVSSAAPSSPLWGISRCGRSAAPGDDGARRPHQSAYRLRRLIAAGFQSSGECTAGVSRVAS